MNDDRSKSSKLQHPSSREIPTSKLQNARNACLRLEPWCFSGAWSLELGAFSAGALLAAWPATALQASHPFQFPTANQALFEKGGEERFFVGTTGQPWTTGMFGCVRSSGWQMHEGLDIRCLQ